MAEKTFSRQVLTDALDSAGAEYNQIHNSYTGNRARGPVIAIEMVGKRGIQRTLCRVFALMAAELSEEYGGVDDVLALASDLNTDDLGLDMIVYFPGWTLAD